MHDQPPEMSEEEFERRLGPIVKDLPTVMEGHALLLEYVDKELAILKDRFELMEFREARTRRGDHDGQGRHHGRWRETVAVLRLGQPDRARCLPRAPGIQDVRRKYGLADFEEPARPEGDEAEGAQGEAGVASGPVSSETFAEAGSEGLDDAGGPEASVPDEAGAPDTLSMTGQEPRNPALRKLLTGQSVGALDPRVAAITFERPAHISEELHEELVATYREIIQRSLLHKRD